MKKLEAFGLCYINDIAFSILELLEVHWRLLHVELMHACILMKTA